MNTEIKAYIYWEGDSSVGINGGLCEAEIPIVFDVDEEKELVREIIKTAYDEILGENTIIFFTGEEINNF